VVQRVKRPCDAGRHQRGVPVHHRIPGVVVSDRVIWLRNFFFSTGTQFFVFYVGVPLHGCGDLYGYLLALFALGWGRGAYLSARLGTVRYAWKLWIACGVVDGLCILLLIVVPELFAALAIVFVLGIFLGLANTTRLTIVQLIVPTEMQGRYFGLDQLGSFAVIPVGQVLGGILIAASGVNVDFLIAGVGVAVSSGVFVFSSKLRKLPWNLAA
jgi:MFS family permease